ncbi:hypothetical protein [Hansschlegelia zhihuaiae]|uniref:DUF4148 domain-containing protein n=1 Tax=Hansschlegelia zhihuaiae TaxID=405005 RepID=A0A4V1KJ57_9HYPH|nr:hypothetical protein [Hansschlegelia zhihuaiae]RXF73032.1 hypothetical protein EK403_12940 [Hansschlegelia zhihuaiae]
MKTMLLATVASAALAFPLAALAQDGAAPRQTADTLLDRATPPGAAAKAEPRTEPKPAQTAASNVEQPAPTSPSPDATKTTAAPAESRPQKTAAATAESELLADGPEKQRRNRSEAPSRPETSDAGRDDRDRRAREASIRTDQRAGDRRRDASERSARSEMRTRERAGAEVSVESRPGDPERTTRAPRVARSSDAVESRLARRERESTFEADARMRGGEGRRPAASARYVVSASRQSDEDLEIELARRAARRHIADSGYVDDTDFDSRDRVIAVRPRSYQRVYVVED